MATETARAAARTLRVKWPQAPGRAVRLTTPLLYPDGGRVAVFVVERDGRCVLSDLGEAFGWLRMRSASAHRPPGFDRAVAGICQTQGVERSRGQLVLRLAPGEHSAHAVLRRGARPSRGGRGGRRAAMNPTTHTHNEEQTCPR